MTETGPRTEAAAQEAGKAGRGRRFQVLTRGTARPEGGGRAMGAGAPAPARQWPILVVSGAVLLGLVTVAADVTRAGLVLVGSALILGALMRWLLPSVGMLAVRSRFTDVITYGVLGVLIVLLALMAQPHPVLEIPFLEDVVRFSVR
ncbi:DUF3017 domain-containing protein [Actinacidiphila sp. bgisy167]|uniref:DUF3017 domain-containing protein n=1 Tax=Actinacidiphila sp. bgisy167 TaxID=3413797 RepID=UPI003D734AAD